MGGWVEAGWWAAAFCYLLATVTRLSFYNVEHDDSRFIGVPMPAIALIWSTCLLWPAPWWAVALFYAACTTDGCLPLLRCGAFHHSSLCTPCD